MYKLVNIRVTALLSLLISVLFATSCVNEKYDMSGDKLNMEITPFEDGVTLPLGSTEQIKLKDLLEDVDSEFLTVGADGSYSVKLGDSFGLGDDFSSLSELMSIPDVSISPKLNVKFKKLNSPSAAVYGQAGNIPSLPGNNHLEAEISQNIEFNILASENVSQDIVSLGVVELDDTYINIALDGSSLPVTSGIDVNVDIDMQIPDVLKVSEAVNGVLKLHGKLDDNGILAIDPIRVEGMDFTGADLTEDVNVTLALYGKVSLTVSSIDVVEWVGKRMAVDFNLDIKNIDINKLECNVKYGIDPVTESIDLSDFSSMMGDLGAEANFDFYSAGLTLEIVTNLGVPVVADVKLVPYYGGKAAADKAIEAEISLNAAASSKEQAVTSYTFDEEAVLALINDIPEKIEIRLDAASDPGRTCVLEPKAEYTLSADYTFDLPLEFGEEFSITYKDTISGLPAIVSSLLSSGNKLVLAGEIENSLPLGLELKLNFLDSDGKVVPSEDGQGVQKIHPGGKDGSATITDLNIEIALMKGVKVDRIEAIELSFNANSEGVAGVPVTENAYLQAVLQAVLPEGITVDLKDLMNDEQ